MRGTPIPELLKHRPLFFPPGRVRRFSARPELRDRPVLFKKLPLVARMQPGWRRGQWNLTAAGVRGGLSRAAPCGIRVEPELVTDLITDPVGLVQDAYVALDCATAGRVMRRTYTENEWTTAFGPVLLAFVLAVAARILSCFDPQDVTNGLYVSSVQLSASCVLGPVMEGAPALMGPGHLDPKVVCKWRVHPTPF
jgi:hypothetical protein